MKWLVLLLMVVYYFESAAIASDSFNRFSYLTINNGLSHNTVNCVVKDSRGFMWFGTNEGLNRYDGCNFVVYKHLPDDNQTISDNRVYAIKEDSEGNLWIGTRAGLNKYDRKTDTFQSYLLGDGSANYLVKSVFVDQHRGDIWVGILGGGLCRFSVCEQKFYAYTSYDKNYFDASVGKDVSSVIVSNKGQVLFVNGGHGLNVLDPVKNEVVFHSFKSAGRNSDFLGKTIYEDHSGTIWVCTEGDGLYRFEQKDLSFSHLSAENSSGYQLSNNIVKDICQDKHGLLWIATDGGGLNILNPADGTLENYQYHISLSNGLSCNAIYSVYPDNQGAVWVGTFGGGVNVFDPKVKQFALYTQTGKAVNELTHSSVLSFCEDDQHLIWIGTDGGGVNVFDPDRKVFKSYSHNPNDKTTISSNVVTRIYQDRNGGLWFGTYSGGLNYFDARRKIFKRYLKDPKDPYSIKSNNVWTMYQDSKGTFWVGTLDGLNIFDIKSGLFREFVIPGTEKVYSGRVTSLLEDSFGNLWLGGALLAWVDLSTGDVSFPDNLPIRGYDVRTMFEDSKRQVWVGTEGGGLARFNRDKNSFDVFNQSHGLPSNSIYAILEDKIGNLWVSTNLGLSRFNPIDGTFRNYDVRDGLQSNQFSYQAALNAHDGYMYFGGIKGFNVFHPDSIHDNLVVPPVVFTDFRLMNKPVPIGAPGSVLVHHIGESSKVVLQHHQSMVTIGFAALNYTSPEKNQYAYKLEGFDPDWNYVGSQRSATYTNLNPGKYLFKVKASNNDGVWNETGASMELLVLPPWWKTTWAYLTYVLLMLGVLFSFRNYLLAQQRLKNALVIKDVEKRKIEEVNQMKLMFYTNISHEFRTPLTLITGPLQKLMTMYHDQDPALSRLKMVYRNAMRLSRLVNQILDFRKIETGNMKLELTCGDMVDFVKEIKEQFEPFAMDHNIKFAFFSKSPKVLMCFDREKVDVIVHNLLSNAFKFTPNGGSISLSLEVENGGLQKNCMILSVEDTGIGIKPENIDAIFNNFYQVADDSLPHKSIDQHGTGIGLALVKECVAIHGGEIKVESQYGQGSRFSVRLPLVQADHFDEALSNECENDVKTDDITGVELGVVPTDDGGVIKKNAVILVVEDNRDMRLFVRDVLNEQYEVVLAEDGARGYDLACQTIPDLIVCDVMMPVMDGFEMAKLIRANDGTNHIPIIFLTALTGIESSLTGLQLGAEDYIEKPFHANVLLAKINSLVESRKRFQERIRLNFLSTPRDVIVESPEEVFLDKAIRMVEDHISDPKFDVQMFHSLMGLSRSVLYRKLEAITGQSVNEFVRDIRLKRAAGLLKQQRLTVSEVSYEVGFSDPQYFSKCFRKFYGMSPSKFIADNPID